VVNNQAPEMPTRFAKQLTQLVRGAVGIGMDRTAAMGLALRCARDSMPPLRLAILDDVAAHPGSQTRDVRRRLEKPRTTVDRQLQSLHMLGVMKCEEEEAVYNGKTVARWHYRLAPGIDPDVLNPASLLLSVQKSQPTTQNTEKRCENKDERETRIPAYLSGHSLHTPDASVSPAETADDEGGGDGNF
jgi:hypothetical protein